MNEIYRSLGSLDLLDHYAVRSPLR